MLAYQEEKAFGSFIWLGSLWGAAILGLAWLLLRLGPDVFFFMPIILILVVAWPQVFLILWQKNSKLLLSATRISFSIAVVFCISLFCFLAVLEETWNAPWHLIFMN